MFFSRLRRHAKWMFLILALVFGLGFVGFGVGAGGIGVGNIFGGGGHGGGHGGSGISVGEAEKRVSENPRDPEAARELATAYQAAGRTDDAIGALEDFLALRPKNVDALRELAGLYLAQAGEAQERAQIAQLRLAYLAPGANVTGIFILGGRPIDPDPVTSALSTGLEREISVALSESQQASSQAIGAYQAVADASPNDPSIQLELAQTAQSVGDLQTTIEAYEKFLKLAPDDPTAPEVRRILKQLRAHSG